MSYAPPLQGISINNAPRGLKRGPPVYSDDESLSKWQSVCTAPWKLILEGAVDSLAQQMYQYDESVVPPKEILYQHEFCWGDKRTGMLNPDMMFIVKGTRITIAGQYQGRMRSRFNITGI